jgi:DNA-binding transcriptional ArsR family regulator
MAVGELSSELPVSRPAVSQHLKVLKDAGLVVDQPVGNRRIYRSIRKGWPRFVRSLTGSGPERWWPTNGPPSKSQEA